MLLVQSVWSCGIVHACVLVLFLSLPTRFEPCHQYTFRTNAATSSHSLLLLTAKHVIYSKDDKTLQQERDDEDRYFFDSRISYFGVGGTHAAFFFAESVTVSIIVADNPFVSVLAPLGFASLHRESLHARATSVLFDATHNFTVDNVGFSLP